MNKTLEQTLKETTKDLLSEESLKVILEAFQAQVQAAVDAQVLEKHEISEATKTDAIKTALEEQDNKHAEMLEKLIEAIDADHANKLEKIVARIDENHSAKLVKLAEKYNKEAKADAEAFKKGLVEKVSKYLDLRLAEAIPVTQIAEAVNNTRAKRIIKQIREAVSLDEEFVTNEIREALKDGKRQIDESKTAVTELQERVKLLTEQNKKLNTSLILEKRTIGLPKEKKDYVIKVLGTKDEAFITENFDYVIEMFEQQEIDEAETLKEAAPSVTKNEKLDQPQEVVTESTEEDVDPSVAPYLEQLKK